MTFTFREAKRENVSLLIGLAGGTGSGKTFSAMRLATGLAGDKPFAMIDTENRRALHYADQFSFHHADLRAPFRPDAYADAIEAAASAGYGVILVDSFSHEHAGDGGLLDWHEEEYVRLGNREAVKMTAWIKPKMSHKAMVSRLLQVNAHLILCFRAEEKLDIVKDDKGKTVIVPKKSLTGLNGWVPIAEKNLPYELTLSFLLTADAPGIPKPIKLQEQHRAMVPLDRPITEETGVALAAWAAGGEAKDAGVAVTAEASNPPPPDAHAGNVGAAPAMSAEVDALTASLLAFGDAAGNLDAVQTAIAKNRADNDDARHAAWLKRQITKAQAAVVPPEPGEDDDASLFQVPESDGEAVSDFAARAAQAQATRNAVAT